MRHQARHSAQGERSKRILRPLSDSSVRDHVFALRHAASAALRAGQSHASVSTIAQVATVEVAAEAAAEIGRKSRTSGYTARQLKLFCQLRDVRSRWIGTDDEWGRLHATSILINEKLQKQGVTVSGMSQRTRQRLSVFESSAAVVKLLTLPDKLLMQAEGRRKKGQPIRYRDALDVAVAVALLIEFTKPLRLGNLVELRLDWLRLPERRGEPGSLAVPAYKVKNDEPLFATLSAHKVSILQLFIKHYRKYLTNQPNSPYLFPSQADDKHKTEGCFSRLIVGRVHAMTGLVINVHLLRGITAALLYRRTRNLDDVRALLGHSKDSDAHEFYLYLTQRIASMVLDEAIEAEIGETMNSRRAS
jgi:site-specific recombinase XerD